MHQTNYDNFLGIGSKIGILSFSDFVKAGVIGNNSESNETGKDNERVKLFCELSPERFSWFETVGIVLILGFVISKLLNRRSAE